MEQTESRWRDEATVQPSQSKGKRQYGPDGSSMHTEQGERERGQQKEKRPPGMDNRDVQGAGAGGVVRHEQVRRGVGAR